jgi:hypothetical protein
MLLRKFCTGRHFLLFEFGPQKIPVSLHVSFHWHSKDFVIPLWQRSSHWTSSKLFFHVHRGKSLRMGKWWKAVRPSLLLRWPEWWIPGFHFVLKVRFPELIVPFRYLSYRMFHLRCDVHTAVFVHFGEINIRRFLLGETCTTPHTCRHSPAPALLSVADASFVPRFCYQSVCSCVILCPLVTIIIAKCFMSNSRGFQCKGMLEDEHTFCAWLHHVRTYLVLCKLHEQRPSNKSDLDSILTGEVGR